MASLPVSPPRAQGVTASCRLLPALCESGPLSLLRLFIHHKTSVTNIIQPPSFPLHVMNTPHAPDPDPAAVAVTVTAAPAAPPAEPRPLDALDRLIQTIREKSEAFDRMLDAQPQFQTCPWHGEGQRLLDRFASRKAEMPVYLCMACALDAKMQRSADRVAAAGIPADVHHATLDNFRTDRPGVRRDAGYLSPAAFLKAARDFDEGRLRNLFLCGPPGVGKGHLAAALAKRVLQQGKSVLWVECARLFRACHAAYEEGGGLDSVVGRYAAVTLLVLDELCLRTLPADGEEILFTLFDSRHKAGRRTVLLGNAPSEQTRAWLGDRVCDRLRTGGVTFCYGEWQSARGTEVEGQLTW